ncbi:hypothetical protein K432DRAFT_406529 [Lepidopterella palustris CBS 459.81]|uniref:Uncharacterized protein n=1 Tax=Lepidopterella palustris CBS 459.81 TaxID=1314670 RepID=A0A8E2E6U9_9PEZI|nr:hypothetical protein K432DRAFT_406529 [Lepidopterella palustris CBS 459.81]
MDQASWHWHWLTRILGYFASNSISASASSPDWQSLPSLPVEPGTPLQPAQQRKSAQACEEDLQQQPQQPAQPSAPETPASAYFRRRPAQPFRENDMTFPLHRS